MDWYWTLSGSCSSMVGNSNTEGYRDSCDNSGQTNKASELILSEEEIEWMRPNYVRDDRLIKHRTMQALEDADGFDPCCHNYGECREVGVSEVIVIDDENSDNESTSIEDSEWREACCHNTYEERRVAGVSEVIVINDEHSDNESSSQEDELQQDRTDSIKLCSLTVAEKLIIKHNMRYVIDKLFKGYAVINESTGLK